MKSIRFSVAQLGAMNDVVQAIQTSKTKAEQTKYAKLIIAFISQMLRLEGGKALKKATLTSIHTSYDLEEDDVFVVFTYEVEEKGETK